MRWALLIALFLASCGEELPDAQPPPNPPDVDPDAVPQILSFSTSRTEVDPREPVVLSWEVKDARSIEIYDATSTLISTFEMKSSIQTAKIRRDHKFFLRATNREQTATAEVTVDVDWAPPEIRVVSALNPILIDTRLFVTWDVRHTDEVRIELDGAEVYRAEVEEDSGSTTVLISEAMTRLKFIAWNQTGVVEREIEVRAEDPPAITRFSVRPRVFLSATREFTITWATMNAPRVDLTFNAFSINSHSVDNFPGTSEGTMQATLSGAGFLLLSANSDLSSVVKSVLIDVPSYEAEPNDEPVSSNYFNGGIIATIDNERDVDHYNVGLDEILSGLGLETAGSDGGGCDVDTKITARTWERHIATSTAGAWGGCARLELTPEQVADARLEGSLVVVVEAENGRTGGYMLLAEEL